MCQVLFLIIMVVQIHTSPSSSIIISNSGNNIFCTSTELETFYMKNKSKINLKKISNRINKLNFKNKLLHCSFHDVHFSNGIFDEIYRSN